MVHGCFPSAIFTESERKDAAEIPEIPLLLNVAEQRVTISRTVGPLSSAAALPVLLTC